MPAQSQPPARRGQIELRAGHHKGAPGLRRGFGRGLLGWMLDQGRALRSFDAAKQAWQRSQVQPEQPDGIDNPGCIVKLRRWLRETTGKEFRMRHLILFFLLGLTCSAVFASGADVYLAEGRGTITIAPDGSVAEVEIAERFGQGIDEPLREQIKAWRFEPVVQDGVAITALAHMQLKLRADLADKNQATVRVVKADFVDPPTTGEKTFGSAFTPPVYPKRAMSRGYGAHVMVRVEVDDAGRVIHSAGLSGWLTGPGDTPGRQERMMQTFVEASRKAVAKWQMPRPAKSGSRTYNVPINFRLHNRVWAQAHWIDRQPEAWMLAADSANVAALDAAGNLMRGDIRLLTELDSGS